MRTIDEKKALDAVAQTTRLYPRVLMASAMTSAAVEMVVDHPYR
jgi:hypothetical protein